MPFRRTDVGKISWPKITAKDRIFSRKFYSSFDLFSKNTIIACSAGIDSTVLTHAFKQSTILNGYQNSEYKTTLVYCNHNLRHVNDLNQEIDFVKSLALKYSFDCRIINLNLPEGNTQLVARELRYKEMCLLAKELEAAVLLGHQADDVAESKIFQFLTGRKLVGINKSFIQDDIEFIRPMLKFSRENVERYAKIWDLDWKEDSSNATSKYTRNFIRNELIPLVKERINPGIIEMLSCI